MAESISSQNFMSAAAADEERWFDFFGLSRELRNEIYSMLTQTRVVDSGVDEANTPRGLEVTVKDEPLPKLFGLSHQFKTEYEEAMKYGSTMCFKDLGEDIGTPIIGDKLDRITKAEMTLLAVCDRSYCDGNDCSARPDFGNHVSWIPKIVSKLDKLKQIDIRIYKVQLRLSKETISHDVVLHDLLATLTALTATARIEIHPFYVIPDEDSCLGAVEGVKAYKAKLTPCAVWTRKDGWQAQSA